MHVDFQSFLDQMAASITASDIGVAISGLDCRKSLSCEAEGSFLGGSIQTSTSHNASNDSCQNPCLQATCVDLRSFTTCSMLTENGCNCQGCCESDEPSAPPPAPPLPSSPPPHPCDKKCTYQGQRITCGQASQEGYTCNQIASAGCDCQGCCQGEPSLPPPPPPPTCAACGEGTAFNATSGQCEIVCDANRRRLEAWGADDAALPSASTAVAHFLAKQEAVGATMTLDQVRQLLERYHQHFGQPAPA